MLVKVNTTDKCKYTFVVKSDWISNVTKNELKFENDIFKKYSASISDVEGELIICNDLNKIDGFCKKIIQETYQEYLETMANRDFRKEQWVYNLLDGTAEHDKILYKDDSFLIAPNYTWNGEDPTKMYLLAFPTKRNLRSIRDLTYEHIDLLKNMKTKTLELIKILYGYDKEVIKMFFHYAPSTYHLHIHFALVSNSDVTSSVEYCHEISTVITNLEIKGDYYQSIIMNKRS